MLWLFGRICLPIYLVAGMVAVLALARGIQAMGKTRGYGWAAAGTVIGAGVLIELAIRVILLLLWVERSARLTAE